MADFKNFDPDNVSFTFKGVLITGYAEGTHITAARNEDSFAMSAGAQGDVVRVKSNNKTGEVTITLLQSSPSNDVLSAFSTVDERTGLGFGMLQIEDSNGTTLIEAPNAWIKKPTDFESANEASNREWTFDCAEIFMLVGGALV